MNLTSDELVAIHAEQRAKERYGVELSDANRADMVSQVKDGRGLFFKKKEGSSKVSIWLVWWPAASRIVPIYYKAGRILTVLPTDAFFGPTPPPVSNLEGPQPCGIADPSTRDCPNMKEVGGGMDGERYRCDVCGKGYFLDYEEMK